MPARDGPGESAAATADFASAWGTRPFRVPHVRCPSVKNLDLFGNAARAALVQAIQPKKSGQRAGDHFGEARRADPDEQRRVRGLTMLITGESARP